STRIRPTLPRRSRTLSSPAHRMRLRGRGSRSRPWGRRLGSVVEFAADSIPGPETSGPCFSPASRPCPRHSDGPRSRVVAMLYTKSPRTPSQNEPRPVADSRRLNSWTELAAGGCVGLLQHLASGGGPSLGYVADELRLSGGKLGDPVDVTGSRTALDRPCDCLQRLLVACQRRLARLFARLDDPLVELANSLRGRLETGLMRACRSIGLGRSCTAARARTFRRAVAGT